MNGELIYPWERKDKQNCTEESVKYIMSGCRGLKWDTFQSMDQVHPKCAKMARDIAVQVQQGGFGDKKFIYVSTNHPSMVDQISQFVSQVFVLTVNQRAEIATHSRLNKLYAARRPTSAYEEFPEENEIKGVNLGPFVVFKNFLAPNPDGARFLGSYLNFLDHRSCSKKGTSLFLDVREELPSAEVVLEEIKQSYHSSAAARFKFQGRFYHLHVKSETCSVENVDE